MPAVAVVGAVAAIGIAAEVGTTFAVIAAVGATLAAVGQVTGVKELSYAGAALGLVGGVGALAQSAGIIGETAANTAGSVVTDTGTFATNASNVVSPASEAMAASGTSGLLDMPSAVGGAPGISDSAIAGGAAGGLEGASTGTSAASTPVSNLVDTINGTSNPATAVAPAAATDVTPSVDPSTGMVTQQATANNPVIPQGAADEINAPGDVARTAGQTAANDSGITASTTPGAAPAGANDLSTGKGLLDYGTGAAKAAVDANGAVTTTVAPDGSTLGGIMGWVEKHPTLALGALMGASSFLSGAMNPMTPAQIAKANADANLANTQSAMLSWQMQNMQSGVPRAGYVPGYTPGTQSNPNRVPSTPPYVTQPPGLINNAPPRTA